MGELTLNGRASLQLLKPNLELYFGLPALLSAELSEEEWQAEVARMLQHSRLTQLFVSGRMTPDEYQDGLAQLGINPFEVEALWAEGVCLL